MFVVSVPKVVFPYTNTQTIIIHTFAHISRIQTTNVTLALVSTFRIFRFLMPSDKHSGATLPEDGRT